MALTDFQRGLLSLTMPLLPPEHAGTCATTASGDLFRGTDDALQSALAAGTVRFHEGRIGGAWPTFLH